MQGSTAYNQALDNFFFNNDHYLAPGAVPPTLTPWAATFLSNAAQGKAIEPHDTEMFPPDQVRHFDEELDHDGVYFLDSHGRPVRQPSQGARSQMLQQYLADKAEVKEEAGGAGGMEVDFNDTFEDADQMMPLAPVDGRPEITSSRAQGQSITRALRHRVRPA